MKYYIVNPLVKMICKKKPKKEEPNTQGEDRNGVGESSSLVAR